MKRKILKRIVCSCLLLLLLLSVGCGKKEESANLQTQQTETNATEKKDAEKEAAKVMEPEQETEAKVDRYQTTKVPEGKPEPVEPQQAVIEDDVLECTISISCATILNNMELLDPNKTELVPADGWILKPMEVTFQKGESVFNVLQRICREEKIHMEYMDTPIYNSAYIEGIHNLYEFDAGSLSGWMYHVNGWFPNYGCSRYALEDGDVICWVYTCDLGQDVGGGYANGSQQ